MSVVKREASAGFEGSLSSLLVDACQSELLDVFT